MAHSRRLKAFGFDNYAIEAILTGKAVPVPLPEGIEIIRFGLNWETHSAVVIVEHDSFEEVPPGESIPIEQILMELKK